MIPWLEATTPFPDVSTALTERDGAAGLLAAGADLSAERLLDAYRHGIFPWFSEGQPVLWWCTDPRMVLEPDRFHVSSSLKKKLKQVDRSVKSMATPNPYGSWHIRFDSAFETVMRACAAPRKHGAGSWISEDIVAGYVELHRRGYAHSSELWLDGKLIGGAYGVCIGRMFYGESMFARAADASKVALTYLVHFLKMNGVKTIDCQQETEHLASLGAWLISREEFSMRLREAISQPQIEHWEPIALF